MRISPSAGAEPPYILIVDDDEDIRFAMASVLRDGGYEIATASNGEEALAYLGQHRPAQLIVLDLMMPVMDGWTFRKEQLKDPKICSIPVVVASAAFDGPASAPPGIQAYLKKPFDGNTLLEVIEKLAGTKASLS